MDKSIQVALMFILTHMGLIFFMYPADIICSMEVGHWLGILTGYAIHISVIVVFMRGLSFFDRKDLIDISPRLLIGLGELQTVYRRLNFRRLLQWP